MTSLMKRNHLLIFVLCVVSLFGNISAQENTDVLHYSINLDVNHKQTNSHIGYTKIDFVVLEPLSSVCFMLKDQTIDSITTVDGDLLEFEYSSPIVKINIGEHFANDTLSLKVFYHGSQVIENNSMAWGGIHYNNYLIYTLGVAFADYPHSYARSWFVAKDVFDDKATYDMHITVNNEVQAMCGGILNSISENEDSKTYHYVINQKISPYLVSMTVGDFKLYSNTYTSSLYNYSKPITVYYQKDEQQEVITNMFSNLYLAVDTLEKSFGKFPFNRISYCVTPKGSMEHVDNISLAEGVLNNEINGMSNIVHELAHSWFGNIMTCSTQEDMWLNEGWTSFTTRLSLEAIYGKNKAKDYFRNIHQDVIKNVVKQEGYLPVSGIDSTLTYGSTVYDKGSLVALSLKTYIGDSLFFSAVKDMINDYSYKNISSVLVRDYLSEKTGIDLTSFFNTMVFSPSTPHYEISKKEFNGNSANISFLQRAYPDNSMTLTHSRIPITFIDENFETYTTMAIFDGDNATVSFDNLPFSPVNAMVDLNEDFQDLTTDGFVIVDSTTKRYDIPNTYFRVMAEELQDSTFIRATLHWIGDSIEALPEGVNRISTQHYWTVEGVNMQSENLHGYFYYSTNASLFDSTLSLSSTVVKDSLILLYRPNKFSPWSAVPCSKATSSTGYLKTNILWEGEYVMAVGDKGLVSLNEEEKIYNDITVFPNPNNGICNIKCKDYKDISAKLYSIDGKFLEDIRLKNTQTKLDYSKYKDKNFILMLYNCKTNSYKSKILIKN